MVEEKTTVILDLHPYLSRRNLNALFGQKETVRLLYLLFVVLMMRNDQDNQSFKNHVKKSAYNIYNFNLKAKEKRH